MNELEQWELKKPFKTSVNMTGLDLTLKFHFTLKLYLFKVFISK